MELGHAVFGQPVRGQAALRERVEGTAGRAAASPPPALPALGAPLGGALWLEDRPLVTASMDRREREKGPQALVGDLF